MEQNNKETLEASIEEEITKPSQSENLDEGNLDEDEGEIFTVCDSKSCVNEEDEVLEDYDADSLYVCKENEQNATQSGEYISIVKTHENDNSSSL